ncbi:unnamed protein product [Calicophoron daubneyi]|uniref:Hexosyltransferase n=1 Tax=Calicophoron daubneyi TaxID=300641 RepID=A0AAV2TAD5_CALDB
MYDGKRVSGSQTKQLVMMDQAMRIGGSNPNFYLYPQTMDLIAAVKSIRSGLHVDEHPINNPELYVIESPQFTCNHTDQRRGDSRRTHPLDLVILVKSCLDCADKRTHIRSTYMQSHLWSGYHVQFAFVVGLPFIQVSKHLRFDGVNFTREHKIVNYTQLKRARVNLFRESAQYNDLLIGGFHDMYFNLTLKLIFTFRWASAFCKDQTPIFLFVDDDISVNPRNLMKFLGRIPISGRTHFNGGMPPASQIPIRPNSTLGGVWAVSEDEFPWERYPSYSLGAGYLVGADYVYDAAVAMAFTQFFRIDDAFLGMVWAKLNYPVLNVPGFRLWIPSSEEVSQTIIAFSNSMDQYINWETGEMKQASSKQPPQTKI